MTKWQHTLNLTPQWGMVADDTITISHLAGVIRDRMSKLAYDDENVEYDKEMIMSRFEDYRDDAEEDKEIFNEIMSDLYNWGDDVLGDFVSIMDFTKVCWIRTA